ncbi:hypothetical protein Q3G72_025571 [Acer saccharum]|nr:hypothetical protein Q3G72_025571 [Acer saccharum]
MTKTFAFLKRIHFRSMREKAEQDVGPEQGYDGRIITTTTGLMISPYFCCPSCLMISLCASTEEALPDPRFTFGGDGTLASKIFEVIDKSFRFGTVVEEAQRAINAAHDEAESFDNCIGVVKLMGCWNLDYCLIPESPFYLEGLGGHMVIVIAEGTFFKEAKDGYKTEIYRPQLSPHFSALNSQLHLKVILGENSCGRLEALSKIQGLVSQSLRLHAQALTLAALAGAAVVEYYDHKSGNKGDRYAKYLPADSYSHKE